MAAWLVLLALVVQSPAQGLDLQVEARDVSGAEAPEFGRAVARALLATGATVIMGARAGTCAHCVLLRVREVSLGHYRIEAHQPEGERTASLAVSKDASEFEQACAVAIQARLLIEGAPLEEPAAAPPTTQVPTAASAPRPETKPPPMATPLATPASVDAAAAAPIAVPPIAVPPPALDVPVAAAAPVPTPTPPVTEATLSVKKAEDVPLRPVEVVPQEAKADGSRVWPWIAGATGVGAGIAAGGCAIAARGRYNALADRTQAYNDAVANRDTGTRLQTAGLVLSGVAVVGVAVGVVGLVTQPSRSAAVIGAAPLANGAMIAVSGSLP